jgi:3-isopropylmalate/(R)-2-methylmalate dehydratase small subunit
MNPFTKLTSHVIVLPVNNIDTDQIVPARFLKVIDKKGMGTNLFADWRYLPDGSPNPDFILNRSESQSAQILLAGNNFGCGSSREHAPWALLDYGFRVVISTSFADIFRNNALKNGLLPVVINATWHQTLLELLRNSPDKRLTIDLSYQVVILPDGMTVSFPIDQFSKTCLLNGIDELHYLLRMEEQIVAYEQTVALS